MPLLDPVGDKLTYIIDVLMKDYKRQREVLNSAYMKLVSEDSDTFKNEEINQIAISLMEARTEVIQKYHEKNKPKMYSESSSIKTILEFFDELLSITGRPLEEKKVVAPVISADEEEQAYFESFIKEFSKVPAVKAEIEKLTSTDSFVEKLSTLRENLSDLKLDDDISEKIDEKLESDITIQMNKHLKHF